MDTKALQRRLADFSRARGWRRYHSPPALAQAIAVESAELLELYLWGEYPAPEAVASEIADVAIFLLYLSERLGIDLEQAILDKIAANERRPWSGPRMLESAPSADAAPERTT